MNYVFQQPRPSGDNGDDEHAQRATSRDEALEATIQAAERSMAALKLATDPAEKTRLSVTLKSLLEEAERIKLNPVWQQTTKHGARPQIKALTAPISRRPLTKGEQIILLKSSYLNGCKFPPWTGPPKPEEFAFKEGDLPFTDSAELSLSDMQEEVLDGWKRPEHALPPPSWFPERLSKMGPTFTPKGPVDLVQDAATDCSVVASMCAGVARAERGHLQMLPGILYPFEERNDSIQFSKTGKYVVRLNFNGCYRKVIIDDRLPVSLTKRVIHVFDMQNPDLLWPALIEKAYLKVRGGYDFPGSNSGTDLWILTGWIPEQVFLRADDLEPHRLWQRMISAHGHGDVFITTGTGKMSDRTERELGLASEHDYAVLDLREVNGQRLLLIKNPWLEGTSWNGKVGRTDGRKRSSDLSLGEDEFQTSRDMLNADKQLQSGRFWMDLDNVIQHFESIYLNWNSGLFKYREDAHFTWNLQPPLNGQAQPRGSFASLARNPQYTFTASEGGTVWILLCRHFRNAISAAATDDEIASGKYSIDLDGHISLATFDSGGRRVLLAERYLQKGWFVDSPQTLLKVEGCAAGRPYTVVPLEQNLDSAEHTFSLSMFSNSPLKVLEAVARSPYAITMTAAWTRDTAGGNAHHPGYGTNPQFAVEVSRAINVSILLETPDEKLSVHLKLVSGRGRRVYTVRSKDIIFDSKDYRHGCCVAEYTGLEAGRYTIICSTFEQQQLGSFMLRVESSEALQITPIAKEGAGRIRIRLDNIAFQRGQSKAAMAIQFRRLVNVYALVKSVDLANHAKRRNNSLLRVSIESGRGDGRYIYAVSNEGEHAEASGGVRTTEVDMRPDARTTNNTWLVLDRVVVGGDNEDEGFSVELFVDQVDAVVHGKWLNWDE